MTETIEPSRFKFINGYTRVTLWVFFVGAILAGLVTAIEGVVELVSDLAGGRLPLNLTLGTALPAAATKCSGCIVTGTFDSANVTVSGLSGQVTGLVLVGAISALLIAIALSTLVAVLAWRLLHRGFFHRAVTGTVVAAGIVLTIGGILSKGALAVAGIRAASEIDGSGHGYWPLAAQFDPTPLIFGLVLLLIASAFEYGVRLQKETEGLI